MEYWPATASRRWHCPQRSGFSWGLSDIVSPVVTGRDSVPCSERKNSQNMDPENKKKAGKEHIVNNRRG